MLESIKQVFLGLNWVDSFVLIFLFLGVLVGRKRGMSQEVLDLIKWLLIVFFGATLCVPVGSMIERLAHFSPLSSRVMAYIFVMLVFVVMFAFVRKMVGEKLVGSDTFGSLEFYLGMMAGGVRFACMMIVIMSFLNARYVTAAEKAAAAKADKDNYGSITVPSIGSLQDDVFLKSLTGRSVKRYLGAQLIPSSENVADPLKNSVGRQRGRTLDEVIGGPAK